MKKLSVLSVMIIFMITFIGLFAMAQQEPARPQPEVTRAGTVPDSVVDRVTHQLMTRYGEAGRTRIEKGVHHVAELWRPSDGNDSEFESFCLRYYTAADKEREALFNRVSKHVETINGHFNRISLDIQEPVQLDLGAMLPIDPLYAAYDVTAHLSDDFYANKIAFIIALNFPYYSLEEKNQLGANWTRKEWAYARMGDLYVSRTPAELLLEYTKVNSAADLYISEYNIFMGNLLDNKGKKLFPKDLKLLSHWNLRDELKSNYNVPDGLDKQRMVVEVMKRIISQEIPQMVINSSQWDWNPYQNTVFKDGKKVEFTAEPDTRYRHIVNSFRALRAIDQNNPSSINTYIKRKFDVDMEIAQPEVEALFIRLLSSPEVKKVAKLIQKRLKRRLEPFDIWYNGFTAKNGVSEDKLNEMTRSKYPTPLAVETDLPNILTKLGFQKDQVDFLTSKIVVDPARGSGHAWGPLMRSEKAHLRTRVFANGMDYKGYNIAVHEFGHNIEQTISLNDVDHYMMQGVPNNAFTEALAFVFQERNLDLLGIKEDNPDKNHLLALDTFWNAYEIMGVSLLDMNIWKWLYAHPEADAKQLKEASIRIAKDIWNTYYADVFGVKDQTLLAIYSHMVSYPLYLSAYSYGHVIDFQIEEYLRGKDLASEVIRMFSAGRLLPQLWMKNAVGKDISIDPLLRATDEALKRFSSYK
ncbi:MAG: hypothetical protein ACM3SY_02305 [Candidatus Omnitrophota bacterium]